MADAKKEKNATLTPLRCPKLVAAFLSALTMSIFWRNVALLATLGVAVVVLFPLGSGPFTVTNGPASALRAFAYIALLFVLLSTLLTARTDRPQSYLRQDASCALVALSADATHLPLRC